MMRVTVIPKVGAESSDGPQPVAQASHYEEWSAGTLQA